MAKMPLVGEEFAGYRLLSVLGRGGMSVVYEAENPRLGSVVALKVLAPELAGDDVFRARFLQESRTAAGLNHPNVIPIYDMGTAEELLFIAMRYVAGSDLRSLIRAHRRLTPNQALLLVGQAGRALDFAHAHDLVHRDVKPANILVERAVEDDEPDHAYLADFGITKHALSRSGLTPTGQFMGTLDYVAPEQIRGQAVDRRADIYSLGCVLFECLTGQVPFVKEVDAAVLWAHVEETAPHPSDLRAGLPPAIDDVVDQALAKRPEDRYPTCREMLTAARGAFGNPDLSRERILSRQPSAPLPEAPPAAAAPMEDEPATLTSEHQPDPHGPPRPPAEDPGVGAGEGTAGPPGSGTAVGSRRGVLLGAVAVVAVILLGAWAWGTLHSGTSAASSHGPRSTTGPASGASSMSQMPSGSPSQAMPSQGATGTANPLMAAVQLANTTTHGKLPPASCAQQSATHLHCMNVYSGIDDVDLRQYPSLDALYQAYLARAHQLARVSNVPFRENHQDCNRHYIFGELAWNHDRQHTRDYSVEQMMAGHVNDMQAAGRVYCTYANNSAYIVWTVDDGHLLGEVAGTLHDDTWPWWRSVHHTILVKGSTDMSGMG
ncbi:MAG TPA: protein kinase [Marmoricola sp.]